MRPAAVHQHTCSAGSCCRQRTAASQHTAWEHHRLSSRQQAPCSCPAPAKHVILRPPQQTRKHATAVRCTAQPGQPAEVEYSDSWTDLAFIALCRRAYGTLAGWQSAKSWRTSDSYAGMVEVSKALMQRYRTAAEQQHAVIKGFPRIPPTFRKLFPYTRRGAEVNAQLSLRFFEWLVGPMKIQEAEVDGQMQKSAVHIERCRYLAESQCAGMCVNLCKSPVQHFFTTELGVPLHMEPNFETYECTMTFGKRPPPLEQDEGICRQACLPECSMGSCSSGKCSKLL